MKDELDDDEKWCASEAACTAEAGAAAGGAGAGTRAWKFRRACPGPWNLIHRAFPSLLMIV